MNLVILRTVLAAGDFLFDESSIGSHEDGSRPWDQLTHVWRSWFALDNLNGLTAILEAKRQGSAICVSAKKTFGISTSENRLETVLNVGIALADNITSGLAGLASYNPQSDNRLDLPAVADRLKDENIELRLQLLVKDLLGARLNTMQAGVEEVRQKAADAIHLAIETGRWDEFRAIVGALARKKEILESIFENLFHPGESSEVFYKRPEAFLEALGAARAVGTWRWLRRWGFDSFERFFHRGGWEEIMHRFPEFGSELILVSYEWGGRPWGMGLREPRGFPREMLNKLFHRGWRPEDGLWLGEVAGSHTETETAVAWLLVTLDGRFPEPPEALRIERLRQFLEPKAMVHMIEEWPGATLELCLLAEGPRAPEWLSELADGWVQQFASSSTLVELLKRKPESGTELLQLLRRIISGNTFEGPRGVRELAYFEEISDPGYVMDILHHWPDAGFELVRLVSEIDPHWLDRFADVWMRKDVHARVVDLIYEVPDVAIEVLRRSGKALGDQERHWFREILRPRVFMDILRRRPQVGVQLLRLVRESHGGELMEELSSELVERIFHPERSIELFHRNPEIAVELLLLARKGAGRDRSRAFDQGSLEMLFSPSRAVDLLGRSSDASILLLDLALESDSQHWLNRFCETLIEMLNSTGHAQPVLSTLPLALVRRIERAAEQSGSQEIVERIEVAIQTSGEEMRWEPRGRRRKLR